jgi:hypothetical protein
MENANGLLNKSVALVQEKSTPEEYVAFRGAMAQVLGRFLPRNGANLSPASISSACRHAKVFSRFLDQVGWLFLKNRVAVEKLPVRRKWPKSG